jgi:Fe-S-cluster containining protein
MIGRYRAICNGYNAEFERNRALHGERIQCRPGCCDCCHQLFQITEIEAAEVSRAVSQMDPVGRSPLIVRAQQYLTERAELVARLGEPEAWGSLPPPRARLACPALQDGRCLIYEHRPLICRKFGMPLWNPDRPGRVYACEKNFREGEEIADGELIQIQTQLHQAWKQFQADYNAQGGYRDARPWTVARAIVEDFVGLDSTIETGVLR